MHWQVDSLPLSHQGNPWISFLDLPFKYFQVHTMCLALYRRRECKGKPVGISALKKLIVQRGYQLINEHLQFCVLKTLGKEDSPLKPYRQGFFPRSGDSEKPSDGVGYASCRRNRMQRWRSQSVVSEELWVHDWLWLEWRILAVVMGRSEVSVDQWRKLGITPRQWEPLKGLKPRDDKF